jgi:hypothetical protein
MAEKPQARGMAIPPGRTVPDEAKDAVLFTESVEVEPEMNDKLPKPDEAEEKQFDMVLGELKDFIWDEGYEEIVDRLEAGQGELAQTVGDIAGRMVNREVTASDEGGNPISRDILYTVGAEVVNELFNVAENAGIYDKQTERADQEIQGEALIYAAQKYVDEGDQQIDPSGPMRLAANALRGKYPSPEMNPKMGVPVEEVAVESMEMV